MSRRLDGPTTPSLARTRLALFALALGGFAIGSSEFVAMGLLPNIAQSLLPHAYAIDPETANAHTGLIVSAYALGVVIGAPTIAATTARLPRKQLLLWLLVAFTLATGFAAVSPAFGVLVVARFLCGLPHGAYFGIASLVAADLMGEGKRARGVAMVLGGLTVANIVGVPGITWIGEHAGWRVAYGSVAVLFALTFLALTVFLPWQPGNPQQTVRRELRVFSHLQVWLAMGIAAIGTGGFFALYTFIAPLVTDVAHLGEDMVPVALVICGVGMTIGNFVSGHFADRNLPRTVFAALILAMLTAGFTGLVARDGVLLMVGVFLIGVTSAAISPAIQTRLVNVAEESQAIAAALNHAAFNIANSLGALLGGAVVTAGLGYRAPALVGIGLGVVGIGIAATSFGLDRATRRKAAAMAAQAAALG